MHSIDRSKRMFQNIRRKCSGGHRCGMGLQADGVRRERVVPEGRSKLVRSVCGIPGSLDHSHPDGANDSVMCRPFPPLLRRFCGCLVPWHLVLLSYQNIAVAQMYNKHLDCQTQQQHVAHTGVAELHSRTRNRMGALVPPGHHSKQPAYACPFPAEPAL